MQVKCKLAQIKYKFPAKYKKRKHPVEQLKKKRFICLESIIDGKIVVVNWFNTHVCTSTNTL